MVGDRGRGRGTGVEVRGGGVEVIKLTSVHRHIPPDRGAAYIEQGVRAQMNTNNFLRGV